MRFDSIPDRAQFYNEDCIEGASRHIPDNSIDLIVTDPPYGIEGDKLHKHYNRKEDFVIDGYVEVPAAEYAAFSRAWIAQAARILRPGGSIYIVSGYTNLPDILNALRESPLEEINHLIWKYNFGVHTRKKFVSSHYHILYYAKPGGERTFNVNCRFGPEERDGAGGSLNYQDREDVWIINREYKPGKIKNKNELPTELLIKMMQFSSNEDDVVCDLFLGGFSTARVAVGLNRKAVGFELNKPTFDHNVKLAKKWPVGKLLVSLRKPDRKIRRRQRQRWTDDERERLMNRYQYLLPRLKTQKRTIEALCEEFGRGRFAILNAIKDTNGLTESKRAAAKIDKQLSLIDRTNDSANGG